MAFKSTKKPVVLKTHKENDMNIYSADYIFKEEVRKGIHHQMTEYAKKELLKYYTNFLIQEVAFIFNEEIFHYLIQSSKLFKLS